MTASELYLFHVTEERSDGTKFTTWMANDGDGYYTYRNVPSTKYFRYYTREQALRIKKELDQLEKLRQKNGSKTRTTYKVMSLKSAISYYCKRMKELMDTRLPATQGSVSMTLSQIEAQKRSEKDKDKGIAVVI